TEFYIQANQVSSSNYTLEVVEVPVIANFEMQFVFPSYLGRKPETIKRTGNAIIPEGTKVEWKVNAQTTDVIEWISDDNSNEFKKENKKIIFAKNIFENTDYQILNYNKKKKHPAQ